MSAKAATFINTGVSSIALVVVGMLSTLGGVGSAAQEQLEERHDPRFTEGALLRYVPAEVTGLIVADVRAAMETALAESAPARDLRRKFAEVVGLELHDVDHFVGGIDVNNGRGIAILAGRFDRKDLEVLTGQNAGIATRHDDRQWFRIDGDNAMAVIEPGVIAVGTTSFVMRALDQPARGSGAESNGPLLDMRRHVAPESMLWGVGWLGDVKVDIVGLAFGLRFQDGVRGTLMVEAASEAMRANVQMGIVQTMASLATRLEWSSLGEVRVAAEGAKVSLAFELRGELLLDLLASSDAVGFWAR